MKVGVVDALRSWMIANGALTHLRATDTAAKRLVRAFDTLNSAAIITNLPFTAMTLTC